MIIQTLRMHLADWIMDLSCQFDCSYDILQDLQPVKARARQDSRVTVAATLDH